MRKISVIGSGPAGCIFSYALLAKGYDVTIYSDRTPEQWLTKSQPTGTAYLYGEVIDIERELGMDFWSKDMFGGHGVLLDFCPKVGFKPLVASGLFEGGKEGCGIDQRMRVARWLEDFEARGGKLVIEAVTPERLDAISLRSDLTVLAAGKADLGKLIPRDESRSVYSAPQRKLAMTFVRSKSGRHVKDWFRDRIPFNVIKFDFFATEGECFWVPYQHKTEGPVYCILWEAKDGSRMDRFDGAKSGAEILERGKTVIRDLIPWERHLLDDVVHVENDPYGWLVGKFSPAVRQPFGRLPSGGYVMPIGDTAVTFDPIGGQGGNHASRNAKFCADAVIARGDKPFDPAWMTQLNAASWESFGKFAYAFNNMLLEPITVAGKAMLLETARNKKFASDAFFSGFPNPRKLFPYMENLAAAGNLVRSYQSTPKSEINDGLPVWTRLAKAEVVAKSLFAGGEYPAPGYGAGGAAGHQMDRQLSSATQ